MLLIYQKLRFRLSIKQHKNVIITHHGQLSFWKVEKAVKPLQNPSVRNILVSKLVTSTRSLKAKNSRMRKQPSIFTTKVPDRKAENTC
jgi:hypothetical protein